MCERGAQPTDQPFNTTPSTSTPIHGRNVHQTTGEDSDANNVLLMQGPRKRGADLKTARYDLGAVCVVSVCMHFNACFAAFPWVDLCGLTD